MPETTGDDVVSEVRARDLECVVAMTTAVEPDFDIVDLPIDDYLVKPISRDEFRSRVDSLLDVRELDPETRELCSLRAKRYVLERYRSEVSCDQSESYRRLSLRIETLSSEVTCPAEHLEERGFGDGDDFGVGGGDSR